MEVVKILKDSFPGKHYGLKRTLVRVKGVAFGEITVILSKITVSSARKHFNESNTINRKASYTKS